MPKICDVPGVREYTAGACVELWRDDDTGRLVLRAFNEGGYNSTNVDLWDLMDWLSGQVGKGTLGDRPARAAQKPDGSDP